MAFGIPKIFKPKNQARPTSPSGSANRPSPNAVDKDSVPMQSIPIYEEARSLGIKDYNISDAMKDYQAGYRPGAQPAAPPPAAPARRQPTSTSTGSSGGRSYGYGGGGGGGGGGGLAAQQAQQQQALRASTLLQTAGLLDLMNSKALKFSPDDALRGRVNGAVDADQATATGAYNGLDQRLAALQATNPYGNLQAQAPVISPQLSALIQSQGGNDAAYRGEVDSANALGQLMAGNWNNFYGAQRANQDASNQSQNAQAGMGRAQSAAELAAQRSALLSLVDQKDERDKQAKMQQVLQLAAQMQQLYANANQQYAALGGTDMMAGPTLEQMGLA